MTLRRIIRLFKTGNTCVTGLRGTGKDMLMANVVVRRKEPYISNVNYGGKFQDLDFYKIDVGGNTYRDFIAHDPKYYEFPYEYASDIYLSDAGVYLPSQYCNELNREYKSMAVYQALSRQVSGNNFHINTQNLNRLWDKVREQSDIYIRCNWCKVLFGKIVIQKVTLYERAESCQNRVPPCRVRMGLTDISPARRLQKRMYIDTYECSHGRIQSGLLIYRNKSTYDTLLFKEMLKNGKKV